MWSQVVLALQGEKTAVRGWEQFPNQSLSIGFGISGELQLDTMENTSTGSTQRHDQERYDIAL
jgi:hypothetical protein